MRDQTKKNEDKKMRMAAQIPNEKANECEQVLREFGFDFTVEKGDFWTTFKTVQQFPEGQATFNGLTEGFLE